MPQFKNTFETKGEEQLAEIKSQFALKKSCSLCKHQKVCGILPLFGGGIVRQFADSFNTPDDLAYICKSYDQEEITDAPETKFSDKVINNAFRHTTKPH